MRWQNWRRVVVYRARRIPDAPLTSYRTVTLEAYDYRDYSRFYSDYGRVLARLANHPQEVKMSDKKSQLDRRRARKAKQITKAMRFAHAENNRTDIKRLSKRYKRGSSNARIRGQEV